MIVVSLAIAAVVAYEFTARAYRRRFPYRGFSYWHDASFALGVLSAAFVLSPLVDRAADASFSAHMAQHVALMLIVPPLILLGAPLLVAAGAAPPAVARAFGRALHWPPVRVAVSPAAAFLIFIAVLWIAHFSPLYQAALENEWIHALEHAAFFASALLFWMWIVPSGSLPRPVPYPVRLLLLFLAIPQGAFLAVALQGARGVLYPHYLATQSFARALADQRAAGEIMWIGGGTVLFVAFIAVAAEWAARERGAACA